MKIQPYREEVKQIKRLILVSCILAVTLELVTPIYATDDNVHGPRLTHIEDRGFDIGITYKTQRQIQKRCRRYQISYELTLAIIKTESEFDVNAVGDNGQTIGLCQIWPKWWQDKADKYGLNIYEPVDNVELMLAILQELLIKTDGDLEKALQYYNTGTYEGNGYLSKVFSNLTYIENLLKGD